MRNQVLIVEDSATMARVLSYLIRQQLDFEPIVKASLAEAKAYLENDPCDQIAAIVDLNLPDAPSGEAVDLVMGKGIPVIVLSGLVDTKVRNVLLEKGVVDYLNKEGRYAYEYAVKLVKRLALNPSIKALVVDDSLVSRSLMVSLLKQHNIKAVEARNGVEALGVLEQHPDIKLVVTDYNMGHMDGFELTTKIRLKYSPEQLVIIGVSMESGGELSAKFIKNGANDFLRKPFSSEEFHCRVMQNLELLETIEQLHRAATIDELTGLFNRRYFFDEGEKLLSQCRKNNRHFSVALMDLDHFKQVNDSYGHHGGDTVLRTLSKTIQASFKGCICARVGGEEFAIIMPDYDLGEAIELLDRFRQEVEETPIIHEQSTIMTTFSIGVVDQGDDLDVMLKLADDHLYRAKDEGRNRVIG